MNRCNLRGSVVIALALLSVYRTQSASGQSYTWNGLNASSTTVVGGSGAWNIAVARWKLNNAGSLVVWPNTMTPASAVFSGNESTNDVAVTGDVTVASMSFSPSNFGYNISQGASGAEVSLSAGGVITVDNRNVTLFAPLQSSGGFTVAENSSSTFGKLQLDNSAGTNLFGGPVTVLGSSSSWGTLLRVLDDNQLNTSTGKAAVILQGGGQFGSSSTSSTTTISNAIQTSTGGGALVGSYQTGNSNTIYSGGLQSGSSGDLRISPISTKKVTLSTAGGFEKAITVVQGTLAVTASNVLGDGSDSDATKRTEVASGALLLFDNSSTWTYANQELLWLNPGTGSSAQVNVPAGNLTFNGGLGLVKSSIESESGGGDALSQQIPTVTVGTSSNTAAKMTVKNAIRDVSTGTYAAGWIKNGGGTLVVPHHSTFTEQQFTYAGELGVPLLNDSSTPLGTAASTSGRDDTASLWPIYDANNTGTGSTVRFFRSNASSAGDVPTELTNPTGGPLARTINETLLVAGLGTGSAGAALQGSVHIGPGIALTQDFVGSTADAGTGDFKIWQLNAGQMARQKDAQEGTSTLEIGTLAEIDAFVRVDAGSSLNIEKIRALNQDPSEADTDRFETKSTSRSTKVTAVFGGGGTVTIGGIEPTVDPISEGQRQLRLLVADGTTLQTAGTPSGSQTVGSGDTANARVFGFRGSAAALDDGVSGYTPGVLKITSAGSSAFAAAIVLENPTIFQSVSGVVDTDFSGTATVNGPILNLAATSATMTKRGDGTLAIKKIVMGTNLSTGTGVVNGNLVIENGVVRLESTDETSIVSALSFDADGTLDLLPDTCMIITQMSLSAVKADILTGRNGGDWLGTKISTSLPGGGVTGLPQRVVGYALASAVRPEDPLTNEDLFKGVNPQDDNVLVRQVYSGDANLSGQVNFDDLLKLSQNYSITTGMEWSDADFTWDGKVDFDDLLVLSQNYELGTEARRGPSGAYLVYLELSAGAPWILEDALSHPEGYELFSPYLGENGYAGRFGTQLQNYNLTNNLVPEPSSIAAIGALSGLVVRRRR